MSVADRLIVHDASVAVAWHVHQSPQLTRYAGAVSDLAETEKVTFCVPPVWDYEVASTLTRLHRDQRNGFTLVQLRHAVATLGRMNIDVHTFTSSVGEVVGLAMRYRLSGYDALYLDLADRLDAPLATYNKALIAACRQFKIKHYQPD